MGGDLQARYLLRRWHPVAAMAATRVFGRRNRTIVANDPDARGFSGGVSGRPEATGKAQQLEGACRWADTRFTGKINKITLDVR